MALPTLLETLRKAEHYLAAKNIPSARNEAQLLFSHILGLKRFELYTQADRPLTTAELQQLREAIRQRGASAPMAYILGSQEFYGRLFTVSPAVLIPRPETEELVEHVLSLKPSINHIIDAGAGSGCIGITLAAELNAAALTLLDISPLALAIAADNAEQLLRNSRTTVHTLCADFCKRDFLLSSRADLVVGNPPYVLPEEFAGLDKSVREYEPQIALLADDFEKLHRGLIHFAQRHLTEHGIFALETHPQKSSAVAAWTREAGFVSVEIRNDLAARPHFVLAQR